MTNINFTENKSEILFYQTVDGKTNIQVRLDEDTVWLTQEQMAELFQRERTVITKHVANVLTKVSCPKKAMCKNCTLQILTNL